MSLPLPQRVNHYPVLRIRLSLTGRSCRLLFQGSNKVPSPVSVGTLQGLPVSPLSFIIYLTLLQISFEIGLVLSYIPDFFITCSSPSYHSFSRAIAHIMKVDFSIPKTERIHKRTPIQRDPPSTPPMAPVALDCHFIHASNKLRCLGSGVSKACPPQHTYQDHSPIPRLFSYSSNIFPLQAKR